ncbi:hypothetical protein YS110_06320 [Acidovorax sp. YS12]|nr:hypothetical protein YS110_06320 [Acidovorax sp. YS12]
MTNEDIEESSDEAMQRFFGMISDGHLFLDGAMSPLTRQLIKRFGAEYVDMTLGWVCTPMDWACPACGRIKRDIARLNAKGDLNCRLVEHHDHMKDLVKSEFESQCKSHSKIVADEFAQRFAERASQMISAYDNAIICDDCNGADPRAKRAVGAPEDFSYSPQEIRRFVRPRPNAPHEIDEEAAARIWQENAEAFKLRLKIVKRIAAIAADNTHWYQELPRTQRAKIIYRNAEQTARNYGVPNALYRLAGEKRRPAPSADVSTWRHTRHECPRSSPAPEDIEYLAKMSFTRPWQTVDESWRCPTCLRTKVETVRKSNKGQWAFRISDRSFFTSDMRRDKERAVICGDCAEVASELGREACRVAEAATGSNYAQFLTVAEIALVVRPQPHGRHNVKNDAADRLVRELVERIMYLEQRRN